MRMLEENKLIRVIADRAVQLYARHDIKVSPEFIRMELTVVHDDIVPLRLQELLDANDFDFMHDISGIHQHLVYGKGKVSKFANCFAPRFAHVTIVKDA